MSDGIDRKVKTQSLKKQRTFSNSTKITQNNNNNIFFSYFIKLQEYWGNIQSFYETKNLPWKR